jgi:sec-independent protein translocase protein TatB
MVATFKEEIKQELEAEEIRQIMNEQADIRQEVKQVLGQTVDSAQSIKSSIEQSPEQDVNQSKSSHDPE